VKYAIISPVRNEESNLPRLAHAVASQELPPVSWLIVDTGSDDGTLDVAARLRGQHPYISLVACNLGAVRRGAPIVRALNRGVSELVPDPPDVVVKVDADVSFGSDHFTRLLIEFEHDHRLGIASGSAWEQRDGSWEQLFGTRTSVWGAVRAYRWECLQDVSPLEERMGWDGIDELRANVRGWSTRTFSSIGFKHHRPEGSRDRSRWSAWKAQGDISHFMGYRPTYLIARTGYRASHDPAALGILAGYFTSALLRRPRLSDDDARAYLRETQRFRNLRLRAREARGQ
jgi:poly-beta-1,6-N-acetyl-D-glucosamine synthase